MCHSYHDCSFCGAPLVLCETWKGQCPWRLAQRDAADGSCYGALCDECLNAAAAELMKYLDNGFSEDDGA